MARPMQKLEVSRYRVNLGWATNIDGGRVWAENWQHRPGDSGEALKKFQYGSLGNLAVLCSENTFTPESLSRLAKRRHPLIINLGCGEVVRLTSTRLLAAAFLEMIEADPVPEMLEFGFDGPLKLLDEHGNETWAIPDVPALIHVEGQREFVNLPYQLV